MPGKFDDIFKAISHEIQEGHEGAPSKDAIEAANNEQELAQIFLDSPKILAHFDGSLRTQFTGDTSTNKDRVKAKALAAKADKAAKNAEYKEAIMLYTEAFRYVPIDIPKSFIFEKDLDWAMPIILGRSDALNKIGRYRESVEDVDSILRLCLKFNIGDKIIPVLLRYADGYLKLGMTEKLEEIVNKCTIIFERNAALQDTAWFQKYKKLKHDFIKYNAEATEWQAPDACDDNCSYLPKLPGSRARQFCDEVEVSINPIFGKHIVAVEDIRAGDTIMSEEPYSAVLSPKAYATHCYHCFALLRYGVCPCKGCTVVVYCGEGCQLYSWKNIHKYECANMNSINECSMSMGHLALRTVVTAAPKLLKEAAESEKKKTSCASYNCVMDLSTHFKKRDVADRVWRTVVALYLLKCGSGENVFESDEIVPLAVTTMLKLLQILPCNAHEISALDYRGESGDLLSSVPVEIGSAIYPLSSLFNHSCDPHVTRNFYGPNLLMRAVTPITKGEQVFDSYGALWPVQSKVERQERLARQYFFDCWCPPCRMSWPMYDALFMDDVPKLLCTKCSQILHGGRSKCPSCHCQHQNNRENMLRLLSTQYDKFVDVMEKFVTGELRENEALPKFLQFMTLLHRLVNKPFKPFNDCGEAIKQVYSMWGNTITKWPEVKEVANESKDSESKNS